MSADSKDTSISPPSKPSLDYNSQIIAEKPPIPLFRRPLAFQVASLISLAMSIFPA